MKLADVKVGMRLVSSGFFSHGGVHYGYGGMSDYEPERGALDFWAL